MFLPVCHFHFHQLHLPCCPFPQGPDRCPWWGTMSSTWWDRTAHDGHYNPPLVSLTPNWYPAFGQKDIGANAGKRSRSHSLRQHPGVPQLAAAGSRTPGSLVRNAQSSRDKWEMQLAIAEAGEGLQQYPAPSSRRPQQRPNNCHGVNWRFLMGFCRAGRQMEQPGRALRNIFQPAEPEWITRTYNITNWLAAMHQMQKYFSLLWQAASVAIIIISLDIASHTSSQRQDSSSTLHLNDNFDFSGLWGCEVVQPLPLRSRGCQSFSQGVLPPFRAFSLLGWGPNLAAGPCHIHTQRAGRDGECLLKKRNSASGLLLVFSLALHHHSHSKPHRGHWQGKTPLKGLGLPFLFTSWGNLTYQLGTIPPVTPELSRVADVALWSPHCITKPVRAHYFYCKHFLLFASKNSSHWNNTKRLTQRAHTYSSEQSS